MNSQKKLVISKVLKNNIHFAIHVNVTALAHKVSQISGCLSIITKLNVILKTNLSSAFVIRRNVQYLLAV